jgi:hypothetical protein
MNAASAPAPSPFKEERAGKIARAAMVDQASDIFASDANRPVVIIPPISNSMAVYLHQPA